MQTGFSPPSSSFTPSRDPNPDTHRQGMLKKMRSKVLSSARMIPVSQIVLLVTELDHTIICTQISTQTQQQANYLWHHKSLDILKLNFYKNSSNHAAVWICYIRLTWQAAEQERSKHNVSQTFFLRGLSLLVNVAVLYIQAPDQPGDGLYKIFEDIPTKVSQKSDTAVSCIRLTW